MRFDENKLGRIWFKLHDIEQQQHFGWHEQMGRVNSVRCALRDSGPMAGNRIARQLSGIDLSAIWGILIEACKDIALYYGGSVVAGAAVGGIGGAFLGGVGAAPGAALGAAAGAQVGGWVMGFLGLKSLAEGLGRELPKALNYYSQGFRKAWGLPRHDWGRDHHSRMDSSDSHSGASFIAQGHVVMVTAILTALTAYLTRGKGDRTVLLQEIRQSPRLGPKVADWMVQNESKLTAHPQLQPRRNAAASERPILQERASKSGGTEPSKSKPASSGRDVVEKGVVDGANTTELGKVTGNFSAIEPGPLVENLAGTFAGGRYTTVTLQNDTILYRAGTANQPLGQFFSLDQPAGVLQTRIDKAVLPKWPGGGESPIDTVFAVKIPAGTQVHIGEVGTQSGFYLGGTQQIVVPKPWTINGVQVINSSPLK